MADTSSKLPVDKDRAKATGLQGWSGWNPFEGFQRDVDRMFDDFGHRWGLPAARRRFASPQAGTGWTLPAVDVAEKDGAYEVTAELPGMDENNIEVSIAAGVLSIRGEKSEQKENKRKDYRLSERRYGLFERTFALPEDADPDRIEAVFKKGVLTVTLPKRPGSANGGKKIAVKAT